VKTPHHREEHEPPDTWREHELLNRWAPLVLILLGLPMLVIGLLANRELLAVLGLATVVAGVLLPRVEGLLKIGPAGVETQLLRTGPGRRTRIRAPDLPPDQAVTLEVETDLGDDVVSYTKRIKSNESIELLELWGSEVLPSSAGQGDWCVFADGPDLPDAAWESIEKAPDMQFVVKLGRVVVLGREYGPKGEDSRYRFIAKGLSI